MDEARNYTLSAADYPRFRTDQGKNTTGSGELS